MCANECVCMCVLQRERDSLVCADHESQYQFFKRKGSPWLLKHSAWKARIFPLALELSRKLAYVYDVNGTLI